MFYENRKEFFKLDCMQHIMQYPLHIHQYIELVHIIKGSVDMQIRDQKYHLTEGDLALIFPNTVHDYHTLSGLGNTRFHILNCYVNYLPLHKSILLSTFPMHPVLHSDEISEDVWYAEKRLFELYKTDYDSNMICSLVSLMLSSILPKLELSDYYALPPQSLSSGILNYIGNHFREDISLSSVAKHFGIGKYALSRIFSNVLQINFSAYVNSLRLDYACFLLLYTKNDMMDIAIECGYHNLQTFYRIFKAQYSCTPRQYRKENLFQISITPKIQRFGYEKIYKQIDN